MIRKHENSVSWKAGALAVAVHVGLLAALLISFNWKAAHSVITATEVDLWDKLPAQSVQKVEPKPEPKPEPVVKEQPKPDPKVEEKQKLEEQQKLEAQQAEIALEKKKQALAEKEKLLEEKKLDEKRRKAEKLEEIKQAMREDTLQDKPKKDNALKNAQQDIANEMKGESDKQASSQQSAANKSIIDTYKAKIVVKVLGNVNNVACHEGDPKLSFVINVLPSGDLGSAPKLTKSNTSDACNQAMERAILASQQLPLPDDPKLRAEFREINITFTPNR